ncbi:MAG: dUTP diphosphatase [Pseudomonadota bacterium]
MKSPSVSSPTLSLLQLSHAEGLALPSYQTDGAAGMDLLAALHAEEPVTLEPGARTVIPTGLQMALPQGHEGQVRARSGLAIKHGITLTNGVGTVDEDYRGEVMVGLINLGQEAFEITRGMRIAQLVVMPVTRVTVAGVATLPETARGAGGFGSTGLK